MRTSDVVLLGVIGGAAFMYARGYRVTFKDGVLTAFSPTMAAALPGIERAHQRAVGRSAVVTSGTDGTHSRGSKHYTGNALDLRTRDLTPSQIDELARELDDELNANGHTYDVLIEDTHIHIEVDPKTYRLGVVRI